VIPAHGQLFTKPRQRVIRLWAAVAILNLGVGLLIALQPERASDIATVAAQAGDWILSGQDVYAKNDLVVVYPPHAIVLLSPLAMLPLSVATGLWITANIAFALLSPYFAARCVQPHAPFRSILVPILMFASWWGAHTLVQFSLFSLMLSMAAMMVAERHPRVGGIYLGLALFKPQIALPVFFWALFTRRWQSAVVAVSVVVTGFAIYCARAAAAPVAVIERYFTNLGIYFAGDGILTGASDLRPFIHVFISNARTLDAIGGGLSLALLAGICTGGFQEGRGRARVLYSAPALVACWSLLTFYHLSYGYVVLLPVLMLLIFSDTPQTPLRRRLLWALQIGMMLSVPGLLRHSGLAGGALTGALINHFDRFFTLAIFVGLGKEGLTPFISRLPA
jgi:hypothetical protein